MCRSRRVARKPSRHFFSLSHDRSQGYPCASRPSSAHVPRPGGLCVRRQVHEWRSARGHHRRRRCGDDRRAARLRFRWSDDRRARTPRDSAPVRSASASARSLRSVPPIVADDKIAGRRAPTHPRTITQCRCPRRGAAAPAGRDGRARTAVRPSSRSAAAPAAGAPHGSRGTAPASTARTPRAAPCSPRA